MKRKKKVTFRKDSQKFSNIQEIDVDRFQSILIYLDSIASLNELDDVVIQYNTEKQRVDFKCNFKTEKARTNAKEIASGIIQQIKICDMECEVRWKMTKLSMEIWIPRETEEQSPSIEDQRQSPTRKKLRNLCLFAFLLFVILFFISNTIK